MDVLTAIKTRRSIGRPSQKPVDRDVIETLLDAAAQAPSHHNTFPWRFHVLTGDARVALGERLAAALRRSLTEEGQDPESKQGQALLKAEAGKTMRAPVLIAVSSHPSDAPGVVEREEHFACAAAVQNMLLAAHEPGGGRDVEDGRRQRGAGGQGVAGAGGTRSDHRAGLRRLARA